MAMSKAASEKKTAKGKKPSGQRAFLMQACLSSLTDRGKGRDGLAGVFERT
jgi:hypothetical protein